MGSLAHLIVMGCIVYGAIGVVVALAFLLVGLDRIDTQAHEAYAFRPLLVPGLILLWPLVTGIWSAAARRR